MSAGISLLYSAALAESASLAQRARKVLAGGNTHDSWHFAPFPPAFVAAKGPHKWDVSGREYIDLWMGHGSLILGHADADVTRAIEEQLGRGTHFGGVHPLLVDWAERVVHLIPSAERVRFTSSGSEAVHLALRIARAFTGREKVLRLDGHYHGWHDELLAHVVPDDGSGLNCGSGDFIECVDPFQLQDIDSRLGSGDIAALLLEPGGGSSGTLPWSSEHLATLRDITAAHGVLLIFDEVISGFRYAPGGVQQLSGVIPDLTILAKVLSGGLPGGAVAGRTDAMSVFGGGTERSHGRARIVHAGTFNGNPVSAAAGVATLDRVADGQIQRQAEGAAAALCAGVNAAADRAGVDVHMFNLSSTVHLLIGNEAAGVAAKPSLAAMQLTGRDEVAHIALRQCLLMEGIDMHSTHGWLSAAHENVVDDAVERFSRAFERVPRRAPFVAEDQSAETCVTVCRVPTCASRDRVLAGCNLPIVVSPVGNDGSTGKQ